MATVNLSGNGYLNYTIYWFLQVQRQRKLEMQRVRGRTGKYLL